jgi:hypothetical protein
MADLTEAARAVRAEVWHLTGTVRLDRSREACPELHRLLDDMIEVLDTDDPPRELPPLGEPE